MPSIQSTYSFLLVGFLYWLLGNRIWPVKWVCSRCNASNLKSKRSYGNNNGKIKLYLLLFEFYNMYLFNVSEKKPTDPKL